MLMDRSVGPVFLLLFLIFDFFFKRKTPRLKSANTAVRTPPPGVKRWRLPLWLSPPRLIFQTLLNIYNTMATKNCSRTAKQVDLLGEEQNSNVTNKKQDVNKKKENKSLAQCSIKIFSYFLPAIDKC